MVTVFGSCASLDILSSWKVLTVEKMVKKCPFKVFCIAHSCPLGHILIPSQTLAHTHQTLALNFGEFSTPGHPWGFETAVLSLEALHWADRVQHPKRSVVTPALFRQPLKSNKMCHAATISCGGLNSASCAQRSQKPVELFQRKNGWVRRLGNHGTGCFPSDPYWYLAE